MYNDIIIQSQLYTTTRVIVCASMMMPDDVSELMFVILNIMFNFIMCLQHQLAPVEAM